ncbi:SAM-dependent MidA family methyltransferase [Hydrogenivirga caldilitoris]|uniref:SAM-dependent MidA family methyltransferase n=1 Tax=Hydrogenivirga caldilitoris TaxID=246264 RepID=A0A497XLV3_9AQUI|nr:SAM-dependent methyltransferase [Hydrogenivirga caldilitoris]RLJ69857.1 SAM-dependent MidA family methyltransferase [Hydrogenivirga caldilitoris]
MRSFRDFMEEKVREYYSSPREKFSSFGDFFTAPELDRAFGEAIADFLYYRLKDFDTPVILELGAGRGLMARDILNYYREKDAELFSQITYLIYELSPYLREKQRLLLSEFKNVGWVEEFPEMEGVILSNEFFDTLPVHVVKEDKELYLSEGGEEVWLSLDDERVRGFIRKMGYEGLKQRVEVCLDCIEILRRIAHSLVRGYHLVIDYGYTSEELSKFPEGTVVGYKKHRLRDDIYAQDMDISAQVNFSALMEYGKDFGLKTVLYDTQRNFLASIPHFLTQLETLSYEESPESIERLSRLKTMLISMGDRFKVLFQSKGL